MTARSQLDPAAELRLRHDVQRVHRLGERALFELLIEVAVRLDALPVIVELVAGYGHLSPELLHGLGGDSSLAPSLRVVPRG